MKNWKTGLAGIFALVPIVLHAVFPEVVTSDVAASITAVLISLGLIAAKDYDKTGTK